MGEQLVDGLGQFKRRDVGVCGGGRARETARHESLLINLPPNLLELPRELRFFSRLLAHSQDFITLYSLEKARLVW